LPRKPAIRRFFWLKWPQNAQKRFICIFLNLALAFLFLTFTITAFNKNTLSSMNDIQNSIITSFGLRGRWQDAAWMISVPDSVEFQGGVATASLGVPLWPVSIIGEVAVGFMDDRIGSAGEFRNGCSYPVSCQEVGSEAAMMENSNEGNTGVEGNSETSSRRSHRKSATVAPQSLPKAVKTKTQPTSTDP
jgi:hypothetical protein